MKKIHSKKLKLPLHELVRRNKEEIMRDVKQLEKIERKIDNKKASSY